MKKNNQNNDKPSKHRISEEETMIRLDSMRKDFLRNRQQYEDIHRKSEDNFDKVILAVSCAGIGWYVAFYKQIDFGDNRAGFWLKVAVLFGFGGCIIFNLVSYHFARWNADKKMEEADKDYLKRTDLLVKGEDVPESEDKKFWTQRVVSFCNIVCLFSGSLGIAGVLTCLAMIDTGKPFSDVNSKSVPREIYMTESKKTGSCSVFDGATACKKAPGATMIKKGAVPAVKNPFKKGK